MKDYKYFIFDLYGTLVDIHTDEFNDRLWNKFKAILSQYKAYYTKDELRFAYFNKVSEIENKKAKINHDIEIDIYDVFKYLFTNKGIKTNEETIKKIAIEFRKLSTTHIRKYSNVDRLLSELKKHNKKIYLLSNAQSLFTIYELKQLDLLKYFDDIFISSDIGYKKPDVLFLNKLMSLDKYDYILMDTGAGISKNVMAFIAACDELIITTTPEPTGTSFTQMIRQQGIKPDETTEKPVKEEKQAPKKETKEIVKCPECGGMIIEKKSKRGKVFYGCNNYPKCQVATWDMPTGELCPECGHLLTEKNNKIKCSNCDYEK